MFARLDTNRDGFIGRDEVAAAEAQFQAHAQQRAAQHGNAGHSKAFDRIDANHDGMISRPEFDAARPPHARAGRGFHGFGSRMFDTADSNKDGRVSQAEAQQLALQHFDQADLNHDGTLTPDERKQARSLMRHPG
jgi:Ca2+-binding EF-hand superfamily protein